MTRGTRTNAGSAGATPRRLPARARLVALLGVASVLSLAAAVGLQPLEGTASADTSSSVTKNVSAQRDYIDPTTGASTTLGDKYDVSVTVGQTQQLRDRQAVTVSWKGARPTSGIWPDTVSGNAAQEEYPVVVMMCRGSADPAAPAASQVTPETCWTQTAAERSQSDTSNFYPPFRVDRYASATDRGQFAGVPSPFPTACSGNDFGAQHWVHFVAADGTDYANGPRGCAGIAPDAVTFASSLTPSNTTYGVTYLDGTGSTQFVIQTDESNASLGCNQKVTCSLVVIPIVGISCDAAGKAPGATAVPTANVKRAQTDCMRTGHFEPGSFSDQQPGNEDLAVSGLLWWSQSNWRNRLTFPLQFAQPSNVCDLVSSGSPVLVYGSQVLQQATLQWGPAFCLDPKLFRFQHVQFSEPASRALLTNGAVEGVFSAGPPDQPFGKPVVQAPVALSGFAIAFRLDNAHGREVTTVNLTPRLLAKLMTMSYTATTNIKLDYPALSKNPTDMLRDPEFEALNPDTMEYLNGYDTASASTLFSVSSDSDVIRAITSYINADPDARAWLDGKADPWGMTVNPNYKGITLPVVGWPVLDNHISKLSAVNNSCLSANPVPFLPLVAAPLSNPINVTLNMQFGISNAQTNCKDPGTLAQKITSYGREVPGSRALFGLVSLADAERYAIPTASLLSHADSSAPAKFTDTTGRTFTPPTDTSIIAAAESIKGEAGDQTYSFSLPYDKLRSDAQFSGAYPGTLLVTMCVPTSGLTSADAAKLGKLMTFMATTGQTPGSGNGQLPPGYVPMTAANGLGTLQDYTVKAAAAVTAQNGTVPGVVTPSQSPTPTPSQSSIPSTGTPGGSGTPTDSGNNGGTSQQPSASASPSASATPSSSPIVIQAVGKTTSITPGLTSGAIPILLAISALTGIAALVTALWGRR